MSREPSPEAVQRAGARDLKFDLDRDFRGTDLVEIENHGAARFADQMARLVIAEVLVVRDERSRGAEIEPGARLLPEFDRRPGLGTFDRSEKGFDAPRDRDRAGLEQPPARIVEELDHPGFVAETAHLLGYGHIAALGQIDARRMAAYKMDPIGKAVGGGRGPADLDNHA